jgi:alpha-glucosidase
LPFPPSPGERSVESLTRAESSILHLYRRLLAARRSSAALQLGGLTLLDSPEGVLAYERVHGADRRVVVVNYTSEPQDVDAEGTVEVSSIGIGEGAAFSGTLAPDEAVILG